MTSIAEIRRQRGVPAKVGQRVRVDGKEGVITSARGGNLMVRFKGMLFSLSCHPTWRFEYEVNGEWIKFGMEP